MFILVPQGLELVFVREPLSVSRVRKQGWFDILKLLHLLVRKRMLGSRSPWLLRGRVRPDLDGVNRAGRGRSLIHVGRLGGGCLWLLGSKAIAFRVRCRRLRVVYAEGEFHFFHSRRTIWLKERNAGYGRPYLGDHVENRSLWCGRDLLAIGGHHLRSVNVEHPQSGHRETSYSLHRVLSISPP